jgi:hypothetical protein
MVPMVSSMMKIFRRENGDELQTGVNTLVRVFIVQNVKFMLGIKWLVVMVIKGLYPASCQ